ncbi:MAG: hypothetical protein RSC40_07095, partial [Clostridia bacterium]
FEKPQKRVLLYGKPAQRISDMMGHATVVMFSPEDIRIVRDGPAARRRFLDMQLSQIRPSYLKALKGYLMVLESRNALLKKNKLEGVPHNIRPFLKMRTSRLNCAMIAPLRVATRRTTPC